MRMNDSKGDLLAKFLSAVIITLGAVHGAVAEVRLPGVIGDGMVLQRDSKIHVWGWSDPVESVEISFKGASVKTKADRAGRWSVSLGPYSAGGPYDMSIEGKNSLKVRDILIGDVWLASGQSNMELALGEFFGLHVDNADRELAAASFPQIRLLRIQQKTAPRPDSDTSSEGWRAVTPESVARFSAVAYFFGRELYQRYHVPIGLIQAAWGGTVAEAWMSDAAVRKFPELAESTKKLAGISEEARADYRDYAQRRSAWYLAHAQDDRGRVDGGNTWADPKFDSSAWPTISLPQDFAACGKNFDGFAGTIWYRRTLSVPPEQAGKPMSLGLGLMAFADVTYFNGQQVGATRGFLTSREYVVPAKYVRAGENTVVVRLTGINEPTFACTGLFDPNDSMTATVGTTKLALNGVWSYSPAPDLRDFPRADAVTRAANPSPNAPTTLFNGMINPLARMRVKGVIWYQGEANVDRPAQYRTLFPALIMDWRQQWGYELPFLFVQLAGFGANEPQPAEYPLAELREAQTMTLSVPATGMASAMDIGNEHDIHPSNKQDVGHRLAQVAAKVAYGENVVDSGPTFESMKTDNQQIRIRFANVGSGLLIRDKYGYGRGFEIAGADGKFQWAQARLDGEDIIVSSPLIQQPAAVRYAWSNTPDGNVYNREALPAVSFRTDSAREAKIWQTLPQPPPMPPARQSGMAPVNGIRMYYAMYGEGPPVLLIHGGLGHGDIWGFQIAALAKEHTVIVADSRGHGRSTRSKQPFHYAQMADDYVALLDFLKIDKVALVGWSDGGIIGLDIAIRHPERLSRLFAFAANIWPEGGNDVTGNPVFDAYLARARKDYAALSPTPGEYDDFVKQISKMWENEPRYSRQQMRAISVPTVIFDGDHDEAIKPEHTREIAALIPGSRLVIMKDASHFAMWQKPEEFNAAVLNFLQDASH